MSTSTLSIDRDEVTWLTRLADYAELTKIKIGVLILVTVVVAGIVATWGQPEPIVLMHAVLGTMLVASSASAMNQWIERHSDALMTRTENRPVPSGRISALEVFITSLVLLLCGVVYLSFAVNWIATAWAVTTWLLYVCIYTPLKRYTWLNTVIGAVAGAMPILIGASAVSDVSRVSYDLRSASLFAILFLWQFPHFMAIAWIYRQQYARAGLKMLTVVDPTGRRAGVQAVLCASMLLPVSFMPALIVPSVNSVIYLVVAFVLGIAQLGCAIRFLIRMDSSSARLLLRASLIYLPLLFIFLVCIPLL